MDLRGRLCGTLWSLSLDPLVGALGGASVDPRGGPLHRRSETFCGASVRSERTSIRVLDQGLCGVLCGVPPPPSGTFGLATLESPGGVSHVFSCFLMFFVQNRSKSVQKIDQNRSDPRQLR